MWVEETKNGKYKAVERYTDYLTGRQRKVSVTMEKNTAGSRKMAQKTLEGKIEQATAGRRQTESITLERLIEKRQAEQKLTMKPSTCRRNKFSEDLIMATFGRNTIVDNLTAGHVRDVLLKLDKTNEQKNEILKRFKAVLNWGSEAELIGDVSYLQKVKKFKVTPHREKIQDKFLESEEVKTLLSEIKVDVWRSITSVLVLSGLRFGELAALRKTDVDFNSRTIYVNENYDPNNDVTTSAKTDSSVREVFMQDELYREMKRLNLLMMQQKISYGYNTPSLFLTDKHGEHIKYYAYNKYLQENAVRAIGRKITPHTLRHTCASLLAEHGEPMDSISRRLGHSDSKITREIYFHVTKRLEEQERARLKEVKLI